MHQPYMRKEKIMTKKQKYNKIWAMIIILIALLSSGVAIAGNPGEYARIYEDPALEDVIKANQLPPDYQYYFDGRPRMPYAVIGIDPKYKLTSKYWYSITSKNQIADRVQHLMPTGATHITYGRILDSSGTQIGLWFSEYQDTIVQFGPGNGLKVFSPYKPNETI